MLINRDELARKVLEGEIISVDDLNPIPRLMIKDVVETAMGAEMTGFLGYDRYQTPASDASNRCNGFSHKELVSKVGPIVIVVPRDRKSEFAPAVVKKRHKDIGGSRLPEAVSRITDAVIDKAKEWQNRPLEPVYAIVFMNALFLKLRVDGRSREALVDANEELAGDHGPAFDLLPGTAQRLSLLNTQPGAFTQFLGHSRHVAALSKLRMCSIFSYDSWT